MRMSPFEFMIIPTAIVLGFGMTEVLYGWGDQLRSKREKLYPLQVVAAAWVLAMSLRYLWMLWAGSAVDRHTYAGYLGMAIPALGLALAARVIRVDLGGDATPAEQYFDRRRVFFPLLAAYPVYVILWLLWVGILQDDVAGAHPAIPLSTQSLLFASFLWLMRSDRPLHHWIGWSVIWGLHLFWIFYALHAVEV